MSKSVIGILTFTFITVIGWIGFELYHAQKDIDYPAEYQNIQPASDYIDTEMLDNIDGRQTYKVYNPFAAENTITE